MKTTLIILLALITATASAQLIPSVGYRIDPGTSRPNINVEVNHGHTLGLSAMSGVNDGGYQILGGMFIRGKFTVLDIRTGFVTREYGELTLNLGYKFISRKKLMIGGDVFLSQHPSVNLKIGMLIGTIDYCKKN